MARIEEPVRMRKERLKQIADTDDTYLLHGQTS